MMRVRRLVAVEWLYGALLAGLLLYLPHAEGSASWVTYDGLTVGAAAIAWVGVARAPRVRRVPMALLAAGLTSSAIADVLYTLLNWTSYSDSAVSIADLFWIGSYGALAAGLLCLLASDGERLRWDPDALVDLGVMLVVSFMVIWETSLEAILSDGTTPVFHRLVWATYPVLDAALAVLVIRMILGRRLQSWASVGLAVGLGLWLASDFIYLVNPEATSSWLDVGWVLGAGAMGIAVAHFGSERRTALVTPAPSHEVTPFRILLVVAPLLLPGAFEIADFVRGSDTNPFPLYAATVMLAFLAYVRSRSLYGRASDARRRVEEQSQHYHALVANSADAVVVVDPHGRVMSSSGNLEGLVGPVASDLRGLDARELLRPVDVADAEATFVGALLTPGVVFSVDLAVSHSDGARRWLSARAVSLVDDPSVRGVVINLHDITDQKKVEDELAHQAFHDSLTGLSNRALFADRAEQALRRSARTAEDPTVLYLDLDGFKKINDSLGHAVGDAVLNEIAARLTGSVRDGDTVGRLGGDEFAVLVEGGPHRSADIATTTAERILEALRDPIEAGGHQLRVTASIGMCVGDGDTTVSDLLRNSDLAMYQAKSHGKDQWVRYEPDMSVDALKRLELETDMATALEAQQFALVYQPVVDLATETVVGFEALIRWHHPTLGLINPDDFIPIAEDNGMILPIGEWVLDQACTTAAGWERDRPGLHMAVNISGRQLGSETIIGDVSRALERSGLPAACLILEITETSLVREPEVAAARLRQLRSLGIRLAIDDFGTGYSSINYLRQFPVDIIKIDRSFIDTINDADQVPPLVRALLALGHTLEVGIVAEGVEHEAQHHLLQTQHCEFGQGFFFARPMSESDAQSLIHRMKPDEITTG